MYTTTTTAGSSRSSSSPFLAALLDHTLDHTLLDIDLEPSGYIDGVISKLPEATSSRRGGEGVREEWSNLKVLVCGGVAGVVSRTATAPLDRLKVLLQVQGQQRVVGHSQDLRAWGIVKAMHAEGWRSMYKGNFVNCVKIFPENAMRLYVFELFNKTQLLRVENSTFSKFCNGAVTGMIVQTGLYPVELIKTRIMTYPASMGKIGPWAAMSLIRREEMHQPRWMPRPILDLKMTRFFKGYAPAIVGSMPFAAIELGCSRTLTDKCRERSSNNSVGWWSLLAIGTGSTFTAMGLTYPCRLVTCQMQAFTGPEIERLSARAHLVKIVKTEGLSGLYRGFMANGMKAVPASAIAWSIYNKTQELWDWLGTRQNNTYF